MEKKVVLVGHCGPDSSYLRMTVQQVQREVRILLADDRKRLRDVIAEGVDLVLFNRELGWGFDDVTGVEVIQELRSEHPNLRMMLVSNYADAQAAAVAAGALAGFGKKELGTQRVRQLLHDALIGEPSHAANSGPSAG